MNPVDAFDVIRKDERIDELLRRLAPGQGPVSAEGLWGSFARILAGIVADRTRRSLLLITAHNDEADDCRDDIETVTGTAPDLLPALETLPGEEAEADELVGERLRLCIGLAQGAGSGERGAGDATVRCIVASIQALMQPVPTPTAIAAQSLSIEVGQTLDPGELVRRLDERGFQKCDQVEVPGDFARRGGIVDVFSNAHTDALRVEFFGDEVESIRYFDAGTQRSSRELHAVRLPGLSMRDQDPSDTTSFLAFLPADAIIAFCEPNEIQELGRTYWERLGERAGMVPADAIFRRANDFSQLYLERFASRAVGSVDFQAASLPPFEAKSDESLAMLADLSRECEVRVLCDNRPEQERFEELLAGGGGAGEEKRDEGTEARRHEGEKKRSAPRKRGEQGSAIKRPGFARIRTAVGVIHRGFRFGATAFVPHHELFHRYRQRRTLRRVQPARPIDDFFDLNTGDHVVHAMHGIGKFQGLKSIERAGRTDEYLAIEFADQAVIHVAISQIHLVQKYIGSFRGRMRLSKLGGTAWKKTKARVADAVTDLAAELLAIQAQRATREGVAYPNDTTWQREFEGSFVYTETEDQLAALEAIKADMTRPAPMDRLLCGDVGFGKTELAIRAAFKTVEYGKQVAVLVPTTVLAEQHYRTFRERLADYPFTIEVLSRFRSKAEQARIVRRARKGGVDILIGTHRLLSKDVGFADLGLVVIDEEQRFGVEAKERLKTLRSTVEVITLTATPIPRTLHMAVLGIRDISSLSTPPLDRRSIVTQVRMWDTTLIRDAIVRELNRDGQVYFVHNFVRDIEAIANTLRGLVPEARIVVGHGQMKGHELEEVMLRFLNRDADVLVSTNIVESGLDIPTANTIFINRAERFGLADLHQLRGRVGRAKHRAYAYMLLSPKHPVRETAARRLKAIEQYSELGAGFQIAMRDLEIRGAGNILGAEQSGHIEAVGYEMYCQLLEQAVRRMKNEPALPYRPVGLELGISATISRAFIRSDRQRMEIYKRLTNCRTVEEIRVLRDDIRDAFGPSPEEVETLLAMAEIRVLAQPWGIRSLVLDPPDVIFAVDDLETVQPLFATGPGSPRMPDAHTVHWRLPKRLLTPVRRLLDVLREQLSGVSERTSIRGEAVEMGGKV